MKQIEGVGVMLLMKRISISVILNSITKLVDVPLNTCRMKSKQRSLTVNTYPRIFPTQSFSYPRQITLFQQNCNVSQFSETFLSNLKHLSFFFHVDRETM